MPAPSGDADAMAELDGKGTSDTFDQLLRRAAAARARDQDELAPDHTAAVAGTEEVGTGTPSDPDGQAD